MPQAQSQTFNLPQAVRGSLAQQFSIPANNWSQVIMQLASDDWIVTDNLYFAFTGRLSFDGGATFTDWGSLTAVSQFTVDKQGNRAAPGFLTTWPGLACILELDVTAGLVTGGTDIDPIFVPTTFKWGGSITVS